MQIRRWTGQRLERDEVVEASRDATPLRFSASDDLDVNMMVEEYDPTRRDYWKLERRFRSLLGTRPAAPAPSCVPILSDHCNPRRAAAIRTGVASFTAGGVPRRVIRHRCDTFSQEHTSSSFSFALLPAMLHLAVR